MSAEDESAVPRVVDQIGAGIEVWGGKDNGAPLIKYIPAGSSDSRLIIGLRKDKHEIRTHLFRTFKDFLQNITEGEANISLRRDKYGSPVINAVNGVEYVTYRVNERGMGIFADLAGLNGDTQRAWAENKFIDYSEPVVTRLGRLLAEVKSRGDEGIGR